MKKLLICLAVIGLLGAALHLLAFYHVLPQYVTFSDVSLFAKPATTHGWFYLDKNIEYPVLTGLFVQQHLFFVADAAAGTKK
ncbi:MAG: hypothetical protein KW802_03410 [Candidatus Doudnabacteria bacterium]|nr:hypothetical protein [Candidatus Doudnabacteria bacterium]